MTAYKHNPSTKGEGRIVTPADIKKISIGEIPGIDNEIFFVLRLGLPDEKQHDFVFSIEAMNNLKDTIDMIIQKYPELMRTQ